MDVDLACPSKDDAVLVDDIHLPARRDGSIYVMDD